ncbi:hypothetical protein OGY15_00445 [Citrobacter sp. Cu231]|uniref:hypothetical protein n=1 Tax=Citrobacter sp. Cu231 TaxID=2985159 RepID=UPI002574BEA9|nr:hypothetical protein [Citrobacter sp. Cu231]MDM2743139.1 hypothetical protein [Citrobacter sp. Cu231]
MDQLLTVSPNRLAEIILNSGLTRWHERSGLNILRLVRVMAENETLLFSVNNYLPETFSVEVSLYEI